MSYGYPKRVAKIDPRTNRIIFWRSLPGGAVFDTVMAAEDGAVWVVSRGDGIRLWRIDPASGDTLAQGKINDGSVFASNANGGTVTRIDAATDATRQIETGHLLPVLRHRSGLAPPDAVGRQGNGS